TVNHGTLTLSSGGLLAATGAVTVNPGATLTLDDTGTNPVNRINTAAALTLAGGTFNFLGAAGAASAQTLGALTVNPGAGTVQTTAGSGGSVALTFAGLTRNAGGLVTFTAGGGQTLGGTTDQVLFTTAPSQSAGVIKGAITNDAATGTVNLATYGS